MPWATAEEIPASLRHLGLEAANRWGHVYDALKREGHSDESAARIAYSTLEKGHGPMVHPGQQNLPGLHEQAPRTHAPVPTRELGQHEHEVLVPSKVNPRVKRWQRITAQQKLLHPSRARRVLNGAFDAPGGMALAPSEVAHVEVQALVHEGLIRLEAAPAHHAAAATAILTPRGREHVKHLRDAESRMSAQAQRGLFKARFILRLCRKAQQIGLFATTRAPAGVTDTPTIGATLGRSVAEVLAPMVTITGFTNIEMAALRAKSGVVVPGEQRIGGPSTTDAREKRTRYQIHRYFYVTPKGAEPIPPVEILTRRVQVFGEPRPDRDHAGNPIRKPAAWLNAPMKEYLHPDGQWRGGPPWAPVQFKDGTKGRAEPRDMEGTVQLTTPCDERCSEARGHKCECSCGGANHGKGSAISYVSHTPREIKALIQEHGQPTPAELKKAQSVARQPPMFRPHDSGGASAAGSPQQRGLHLQSSKSNPRVKRWERDGEKPNPEAQPRPSSEHVEFKDPATGKPRTGKVQAGGAKGITVVDHETGLAHRVAHGEYTNAERPKDSPEPAKKPEPKVEAEPVNYREKYPDLNKYPPKDATDVEEFDAKKHGGDADDEDEKAPWKLRWRAGEGPDGKKKMINAYSTSDLRENMRRKFETLGSFGHTLSDLRGTLEQHMREGAQSEKAVLAAMVRIVDHTAMRAGNESSIKQGVHGVSTLLKSHVKVDGDTVRLKYVGKSSVPQEHAFKDHQIAAIVQHLLATDTGSDRLFHAPDAKGKHQPVKADRLNDYVKTHAGTKHSLKDLRTFHATRIFSEAVDKAGPPTSPEDAEQKIQAAAVEVAKHLGHKRGISPTHFARSDKPATEAKALAKEHGGTTLKSGMHAFETAKAKKAFIAAHGEGATSVEKKDVADELPVRYEHEGQTSLDNYIDPTVVEAFRQGHTLSHSPALKKAAHANLSLDERRFVEFIGRVEKADPLKFRGTPE